MDLCFLIPAFSEVRNRVNLCLGNFVLGFFFVPTDDVEVFSLLMVFYLVLSNIV